MLSNQDLDERLRALLLKGLTPAERDNCGQRPHIEATFADHVIYSLSEQSYFRRNFEVTDEGGVEWTGDPIEIAAFYVPVKADYYSAATFTEDTSDGFVRWEGKIFEIGEYPDMDFKLTKKEADAAIAAFGAVDNNIEHYPSVFDGKLGRLEAVWRDDLAIMGRLAIPDWLADKLAKPLKVSLEWGQKPKRIIGNALTLTPRVADAAVFTLENKVAPAYRESMSSIKELFRKVRGMSDDELERLGAVELDQAEFARLQSEAAERDKELELASARLREQEEARLSDAATAFADELLGGDAKKIVPAQKDAAIALFTACAKRDAGDKALFSEGRLVEGESVKALREFFAKAPALRFTGEIVETAEFAVLANAPKSDTMSPERMAELQAHRAVQAGGNA